jgi:N-acetylmuramoyl-L-alanine amidase
VALATLGCASVAWLGLPLGASAEVHAQVRGVRHWSYPGFSRVSVELSGPVEVAVQRLPAEAAAGRPERLYLDLEGARLGAPAAPLVVGDGLLDAVRLGQNRPDTVRVVIDLERYGRHRMVKLAAPDRIVIDVFGDREAPPPPSAAKAAKTASRASLAHRKTAPQPLAAYDLRTVRSIVLDPGHGGKDPGATGQGGLVEKEVTLDLARRMRERLQRWGFRVIMTRDGDESVDLEERTARAEGGGGDVFLSLHVNAAPRAAAAGIETYYLDESDERHSDVVAARENGITPAQAGSLQRTLAQLRVTEVSQRSGSLARYVHGAIVRGLRARYGATEDLGVRQGPFYVLFLSSMPAILVEVGFATNPVDAERLRDEAYLELLADRIASGLMAYAIASAPVVARDVR